MRMLRLCFLHLLIIFISFTAASAAETAAGPHIRVKWIAPKIFSSASETVGIHFAIDPGWHIYWKNPGDSGAAPKFHLSSNTAKLGDIGWPVPLRLPIAHLMNLGYENTVTFPFTVQPLDSVKQVDIEAHLEWLVCQEECIPGFATISLSRPIAGQANWSPGEQTKLELGRIPKDQGPWVLQARSEPGKIILRLSGVNSGELAPEVFPTALDLIDPHAPEVQASSDGFTYIFTAKDQDVKATGFVVAGKNGAWEYPSVPIDHESVGLALVLLSALLGGVLLNLMPCVLPVLSIKFFSLAKMSTTSRLRDCLLYSAGVVLTFTALGGIFLGLRMSGSAIGWGYQLQSPAIVLALVALFYLMGLNFFGFFEFGSAVMFQAGKVEARGTFAAFLTGMLSVFLAAPCTGPFMGTALGVAATLAPLPALLIFVSLGVGLALPFLLFAIFPGVLNFFPRPGAWMERFKQLLAFPLFATVIWLLWVLGQQVGTEGWYCASVLLLSLTFAIWVGKSASLLARGLAVLMAIFALVFSLVQIRHQGVSVSAPAKAGENAWQPFSAELVAQARARHQAVFVDFTASWCITCQVNKKAVLETSAASAIFAKHNVLLVTADWTNQDAAITRALAQLNRNSVPVYAFYPADGSGVKILPQILTLATIEELF